METKNARTVHDVRRYGTLLTQAVPNAILLPLQLNKEIAEMENLVEAKVSDSFFLGSPDLCLTSLNYFRVDLSRGTT